MITESYVLEAFLAQYSPMQAGAKRKAMMAHLAMNGLHTNRLTHAYRLVDDGYKLEGHKIVGPNQSFYLVSDCSKVLGDFVEYLRLAKEKELHKVFDCPGSAKPDNDKVFKEWRANMPDAETTRKLCEG
jgi:hypothetical protein